MRDVAIYYLLEGHAKRFLHFDLNHGSFTVTNKISGGFCVLQLDHRDKTYFSNNFMVIVNGN